MTRARRPGTTRPRRIARALALAIGVLLAATLAAGCGDDDDGATSPTVTTDAPAEPRSATPPEASADLEAELGDAAAALTDAGCRLGTYDLEDPVHVEVDELEWDTFPPASGQHLEDWAPFGTYDEPVPDGYAVHNLEHGGVAVWLGEGVDVEAADAIDELLDDGEKWLVAPREDLIGLASVAWGSGLACTPEAVEQLGPEQLATALDAWYEAVASTGSEAEKDVPAYAGAMKEPSPTRDISEDSPF